MQGRLQQDQLTPHVLKNQTRHALRAANGLSLHKGQHALQQQTAPGRNKKLSPGSAPYGQPGRNSHV